jgi:multisubunit Na+/H+ antiporter MnhG subunit
MQVLNTLIFVFSVAVYGTESGISSKMAALGAILIFLGVFLCLAGFRMSKVMLCVMGLLTFGSMTWIALANCRPEQGYSRDTITMIVVPVGVGVAGAIAYYFVWNIAIYLVGGNVSK